MVTPMQLSTFARSETAFRFEGAEHGSTISFFVTRHPPGKGADLHFHPYEETFLVQEGAATFSVDGEDVEVGAGQIVVVPAGAVHGFRNSGEGDLRQVSIHPRARMEQTWV